VTRDGVPLVSRRLDNHRNLRGTPSGDLGLCFPSGRNTRFGSKSDSESNIPHWDQHVFYICLPTNTPVAGRRNPAHKHEKSVWRFSIGGWTDQIALMAL